MSMFKIHWNCNIVGLLHHPFWLYLVLAIFGITSHIFNFFVLLRITDEGSVPEMRIWSISNLIRFKWCIHLSRSLFLNFKLRRSKRGEYHHFRIEINWWFKRTRHLHDTGRKDWPIVFSTSIVRPSVCPSLVMSSNYIKKWYLDKYLVCKFILPTLHWSHFRRDNTRSKYWPERFT